MDSEIAWEDCIGDLPLDAQDLPPLNALAPTNNHQLPNIDLLDLLSFDTPDDRPQTPPTSATPTPSSTSPPHNLTPTTSLSPGSLSRCTSPDSPSAHIHIKPNLSMRPSSNPPSQSSITSAPSSPSIAPQPSTVPAHAIDSQAEVVLELSTRLASATAEASTLRKRVASLTSENRSLRAALDHANARLVAVAQAASAQPPPTQSPVVLGLTHLTADVASRFSNALTVSDISMAKDESPPPSPPDRKKRKRVTGAATTMACVMFLWGAMVGSPGWLSSSNSSPGSDGNLPAVWKQESAPAPVPAVVSGPRHATARAASGTESSPWLPNCMRVLQQLPDGASATSVGDNMVIDERPPVKQEDVPMTDGDGVEEDEDARSASAMPATSTSAVKTEANPMFVDMRDGDAAAAVRSADARDPRHPQYSYVLCRDAQAAMDSVRSCATRMQRGETCGEPHTISLIMPAEVADGPDNGSSSGRATPVLAEVQCAIMSVARIPVEAGPSKTGSASAASSPSLGKYGRVIATVPETGTVIRD